jgi:putative nucleotidyltransferase with HDIG domain
MKEQYEILIVDDNESLCNVLATVLTDEGYRVIQVYRGDDAVEELKKRSFDLVLLDLVLPGVDGMDVFREIREKYQSTDVITITSYTSTESAVEALRMGAQDYLTKPLDDLDIVTEVVSRTFENRRIIKENEHLNKALRTKAAALEASYERISMLNRIGQALHSILDFRELLTFIVQAVAAQLGSDRVSLMLYDGETGELKIEAAIGFDEGVAEKVRIRKGDGIAGLVAKKGEPVLVEDITKDPRFQKKEGRGYGGDSFISAPIMMSVPIKYQQRTLGVINVNNKCGGAIFAKDDLDFVTTLAAQAAIATDNALMFQQLEETRFEAIMALGEALEAKDLTTGRHSDRLLRFALGVAERLGLDHEERERLRYAAVLHDIGKIGIPESILQKPGRLTDEEYRIMKKHPELGAELVRKISFLEPVSHLILTHHEWYNGRGYPRGLSDEDIPVEARIVAVLDAYDAMISDRPYRKALGNKRAVQELKDFAGTQFDPKVVEEFISVIDEESKNVHAGDV